MNGSRSWVEINLGVLRNNLEVYRESLLEKQDIMAVVKADTYGHGDRVIAKYLSENGVHSFAVSNIDEAIHIREAGAEGIVLILGYTPVERAEDLMKYDITQALLSEEYAEEIRKTKLPIKCQFAIDTGMRRIGLNADELDNCERVIRKYSENLTGLFTHLCVADTPEQDAFTDNQIKLFETVCDRVADLHLPYLHCMNSAGGLWQ